MMQFETLQKDMIAAMKAKDKVRKEAISSLISAVKKTAFDEGTRDNITEELVKKCLRRLEKLLEIIYGGNFDELTKYLEIEGSK